MNNIDTFFGKPEDNYYSKKEYLEIIDTNLQEEADHLQVDL